MSFTTKFYRVLKNAIQFSVFFLGKHNKNLVLARLAEEVAPTYEYDTKYGKIVFYCIGELPLWRAETLLSKEPETVDWIDSFENEAIFYDIGANIGCYSLYAAKKGISVYSFEPSAANYFLLQKNIEKNHLDSKIQAFCLALSDLSQIGFLHLSTTKIGGALHSFGDLSDNGISNEDSGMKTYQQGMIGYSLDDFISNYRLNPPNYIKIDVDGIEDKIIRGAKTTLSNKSVQSILVELDTAHPDYHEIIQLIESHGLKLGAKKHASIFDSGPYSAVYNHIFIRSDLPSNKKNSTQ